MGDSVTWAGAVAAVFSVFAVGWLAGWSAAWVGRIKAAA